MSADTVHAQAPRSILEHATLSLGPVRHGIFENRISTLRLLERKVPCISPTGEVNNFEKMSAERAAAKKSNHDPLAQYAQMLSPSGLRLANVGVSVALVTNLQDRRYLVAVRQERPDFGDSVIKLISGYVNFFDPLAPQRTFTDSISTGAVTEISEEPLPWQTSPSNQNSGLLKGMIQAARSVLKREVVIDDRDGTRLQALAGPETPLATPYEGRLPYLPNPQFRIRPSSQPLILPSVTEVVPIEIDGELVYAALYLSQTFQSCQVVFFYDLELPQVPDLSLSHCENVSDRTSNTLVEQYQRYGAPLLELDEEGLLTGVTRVLDHGKLVDVTNASGTSLSEAFVPSLVVKGHRSGIVTAKNIDFDEFLRIQRGA